MQQARYEHYAEVQNGRDLYEDDKDGLSAKPDNHHRFKNSSDDVRYLAQQNRLLMERLTIAESDIATLKDNYSGLKEDYNSLKQSAASCFEGRMRDEDDAKISELDDIKA